MAYIESFLLYLAVIISVYILFALILNTIIWIFARIYPLYKKKWFLDIFLRKFSFKKSKNLEDIKVDDIEDLLIKDNRYSDKYLAILKSNFMAVFTILYFFIFAFVYLNQSIEYYGSKRAYPQAKAYAIVGNTVQLYHMALFSNPRINLAENDLDKQFMRFFDFILGRMNQYIPNDDAERDYWLEKYKYAYIAKTRYTPVTDEYAKKRFDDRFFYSELEAASYEPRFLTMMDEMYRISKSLMYGNMKDEVLNEGRRYIPIAQMSYYLSNKIVHYASLESDSFSDKMQLFYQNEVLIKKFVNNLDLLLRVNKKIETDKKVKKEFDKVPFSYAFLYSSILFYSNELLNYNTTVKNIYPCTSNELIEFLNYHRTFYKWINSSKSFMSMSKKAKENAKILFDYDGSVNYYNIAKYICNIPINYLVKNEKDFERNPLYGYTLKTWMLKNMDYERYQIKRIIDTKEKYEKEIPKGNI